MLPRRWTGCAELRPTQGLVNVAHGLLHGPVEYFRRRGRNVGVANAKLHQFLGVQGNGWMVHGHSQFRFAYLADLIGDLLEP